ncbi:procathepsin L isoform X2 [Anolis carolinensis]|uniref:procathepsin L isoform X2 n=1 Tax=Anolis carolinensis TaxID=28377 RepID=UPI000462AD5E|nr:PREDICTED: cathepsin L1 isoform X2 [Anolis carolinensis]|eukprot:XP_008122611.1 PREDICTED: cathepsin L1 isoform X2 [Anolis carolinensis]
MGPLVLAVLVATTASSGGADLALEGAWRGWKGLHRKEYLQEEESFRRSVWEKNLQRIAQHNTEASLGRHSFHLAMNHYGDLGHCGACWAFSATGALEGLMFNKTGKLVSLSEQNLIDCSTKMGNHGCRGGYITKAFEYVRENGGIDSEQDYPYLEQEASGCRYNAQARVANCSSLVRIQSGSEEALEHAVATVGPVSVAVDAQSFFFHFYKSGVFSSSWCGQRVNHAMLAVGYGVNQAGGANIDYWILKNSWTENWGEGGYMRLVKGAGNHCGVANQASYPTI